MKQIAQALVKAQKAFAPALKTSSNPHFKSRYADLAACVEAVIDALNNNGIALIQQTHECTDGVIVETGGKLHVPAAKQDPQGYGSALTYARRYSLMATCGIAPEDDDGNAASKRPDAAYAAFEAQWLPMLQDAAMEGVAALNKQFAAMPNTGQKRALWAAHGPSLKNAAEKAGE